MGTELMRVCAKAENEEFPSVPPGFESFSSVPAKGVKDEIKEEMKQESVSLMSCSVPAIASELPPVQIKMEVEHTDTKSVTRSLRRRSWVKYNQRDCSSDDDSDCEKSFCPRPQLPKGVIRGCSDCSNCQKVIARWRPEDAHRPDLEDAPAFYPTEEEFQDTLNYIASIRPRAEQYGICRIVPPPSWRPPCPLKEKNIWENSHFATRVQRVDKLQNRDSMRKMSHIQGQMRRKRRKCMRNGVESVNGHGNNSCLGGSGVYPSEFFGFEPGPQFTLDTFEKYANEFKAMYFSQNENGSEIGDKVSPPRNISEPSLEDIEGEYWRMVEKPTEEIEVLYGADLETGVFGSGFPKMSSDASSASEGCYTRSGWNLNNFPRLPGSVLSYETGDISGVLVPWLYIGMCFSSFCWHVEDHHLYSLNYMHWGSPKLWYGVPGMDAVKLEKAMKKHLPDLFEEQPDLLHKLVTQLSPSILKSVGVPVYRCIQKAGEFVLTFPRAYHSGFNSGFNCAEAVNVAPVDWLPHGQIAVELYRVQGRKTSVSHDKLLLGAAREAVKAHWEINLLKKNTPDNLRWNDVCGKDGILMKTLKTRVETERARRESICNSSRIMKMESNFDSVCERECIICLFDLHLSAVGCHCSPDRYACLDHAKQLCSCAWGSKYFLFRYDINELNILVEALEGKLSAIYRWARFDLGLALSSYVSNQTSGVTGKISHSTEGTALMEPKPHSSVSYIKDLLLKNLSKNTARSSTSHGSVEVETSHRSSQLFIKEESRAETSAFEDSGAKKPLTASGQNEVILLSDDEDEKPKVEKQVLSTLKGTSVEERGKSSERVVGSDNSAATCNTSGDAISTASICEKKLAATQEDANSLPDTGKSVPLSIDASETTKIQDLSLVPGEVEADTSPSSHGTACSRVDLEHSLPCGSEKLNNEERREKSRTIGMSNAVDSVRSTAACSSTNQNNLDKYFRQKGPRIAKVVRRINCNVEPLEYGSVLAGKSWSNSQVIFPKGFRSRVRYFSILEPTSMCYYVSEILDAGEAGPLFKVSVEHNLSELFIHISPTKCWEMVRERVNQEITKHHRMGKSNLPPLQPPGSLDGFEMFGFSSPAVVQAIEALDRNRVCTNYWDSRPYSRPQVQIPRPDHAQNINITDNTFQDNLKETRDNVLPGEANSVLKGLLKKADLEELRALHSILMQNSSSIDRSLVAKLLTEEILKRPR
ncbi:putative lysine-specific demethylase JMJ16 [Punica granatum]|nr:putative lysine-specific demethylase JMJ16 [Punica granatum]XP_031378768.1 putative lysine-specific demethylase JMJ16 [Punica granatum]XP_031378769.1 putative lysine-specific demethylase JMJ16 [Punica granatum]PKI41359.1 hypothetical protein CRG98_038245 [Punica granatum]